MRTKDLVYALEELNIGRMEVEDYQEWLEEDDSAEEVVDLIIEFGEHFKSIKEDLEDE